MKNIVITCLNNHNLIEYTNGKIYAFIEENKDYDILVTYEGFTTLSQSNKNGSSYLFNDGVVVKKIKKCSDYLLEEPYTLQWDEKILYREEIKEPVTLFINDKDLSSRKKSRTQ